MRGEGAILDHSSKIARKLTREVFDTPKDVFLDKLFVFEGLGDNFKILKS